MSFLVTVLKPLVEKFPAVANFYRNKRDSRKLTQEVTFKAPLGFKFNGSDAMEKGTFEPNETYAFE